ncbi:glycoside hydrolase family 2 protein [Deinococcus sonorensis]|uniref:Sugar-binding domain-containing protein n=2 Tax=Deinococcus sonorensis TaxID=309891 RepID=A0AAU7UC49_9DEIO
MLNTVRVLLSLLGLCLPLAQAKWAAAPAPLVTRWGKAVTPANVLGEYPRPQLVRRQWQNLNGLWSYAFAAVDAPRPQRWAGQILVPFPLESALSGVRRPLDERERLWYRRSFTVPAGWHGQRLMLNFGAADWDTVVWVNGHKVGEHTGGYDAFSFDVTDALSGTGPQELVVSVWDPGDSGGQPRGKQVREPHDIWYTSSSGLWQTVWLEPVPVAHIASLHMTPDIDRGRLVLRVDAPPGDRIHAVALAGSVVVAEASGPAGAPLTLQLKAPKLWSPSQPYLYRLTVELQHQGRATDRVSSYFGMRKISVGPDAQGRPRLLLNNRPLFQLGVLDQGFWPDGLYTAPSDAALRSDLETLKRLGFNTVRKHVKVEPERWYYWADKLGLLVWQDMPSGDETAEQGGPDISRLDGSATQFQRELTRLVTLHQNHPSIVMWVLFNEGWGQFDTARLTTLLVRLDPTRLVDSASGWNDREVGNVLDWHRYPGPEAPPATSGRAAVLGEFGGLGLPLPGHTWQAQANWGYRTYSDRAALTGAYTGLITRLEPLVRQGLSAAIYTQTTDVEIEVNGLLTYDRALLKMNERQVRAAHDRLFKVASQVR